LRKGNGVLRGNLLGVVGGRERWGGGNLVLFSLLLIVPCGSLGVGGEEGQLEFLPCLLPINFYSRTDANKENPTV
jgi:hypothetical protein